jgi:hypothetical protein
MNNEVTLTESGMQFGPYPIENFFRIESGNSYTKIQHSVKIAEFLLLRQLKNPQILIIEAKTSSPREIDDFIDEISNKFRNTLVLFTAMYLKRHTIIDNELPVSLQTLDLRQTKFRFVLVIKKCKTAWLPELEAALQSSLKPLLKTWNFSEVFVMNEEIAREKKLIS